MTEEIFCAACLYTAAEGQDKHLLKDLCLAAESRLRAMLLEGTDVEAIKSSVVAACAMLASADFTALRAGSGLKSLVAGPVSVTRDDSSRARSLREQAMVTIGPWCKDAFCFMGVRA